MRSIASKIKEAKKMTEAVVTKEPKEGKRLGSRAFCRVRKADSVRMRKARGGAIRSENADMSSEKRGEKRDGQKPKGS
jgi:hypothetical protein